MSSDLIVAPSLEEYKQILKLLHEAQTDAAAWRERYKSAEQEQQRAESRYDVLERTWGETNNALVTARKRLAALTEELEACQHAAGDYEQTARQLRHELAVMTEQAEKLRVQRNSAISQLADAALCLDGGLAIETAVPKLRDKMRRLAEERATHVCCCIAQTERDSSTNSLCEVAL